MKSSLSRIHTALNTALTAKYADPEKYHEYVLSRGRNSLAAHVAEIAKHNVDKSKGLTALDLGAGTGIISAALQKEGFQVTATDADSAMVGSLAAKLLGVTARQLDFNTPFDLKANAFDVVTTVWANRYLTAQGTQNFISEAHRVLKPSGVLIWPIFLADHVLWRTRAGITHSTTAKGLAKKLAKEGFTDIHIDRAYKQRNRANKELPNWVYPVYVIGKKA